MICLLGNVFHIYSFQVILSWIKNQDKNYGMKSRYIYTKLIFGTSNFVVFYVSIKHVTCFLQGLHPIFPHLDFLAHFIFGGLELN